jgi:hypothetical protein
MNQAAQQLFLDKCEQAFLVFAGRHPEYEQTEINARLIATELKVLGLSPTNAEHIQIAWDKLKPAPVEPEVSDVEKEARALINSGRITLDSINSMSNNAYELASRSAVFCRCVELLSPRREPSVLTAGDVGAAVNAANLETGNGHFVTAAQKVQDLENWTRDHFAKLSEDATQAPSAPRGIANPGQDMPMPKSVTPKQFADAIRQERADQKFLESAEQKSARVRRVKANRAKR